MELVEHLINLIASYNWWQIYLIGVASYLIMFNLMIAPLIWNEVKKKVGPIKWKQGPYYGTNKRIGYTIVMNMVHGIFFPFSIIIFLISDKIFIQHMSQPIIKDVNEYKKEEK